METLAGRLDKVERENRWLKRAGVVALAVIAAVVLMGQATATKVAKVVEAEEFVLRDASGTVRSRLEVVEDTVSLTLLDRVGKKRLSLGVKDNAWVELIRGRVNLIGATLQLGPSTAKSPWALTLVDGIGKRSMGLATRNGSPVLFLGGEEGSFVVSMSSKGPMVELSLSDDFGYRNIYNPFLYPQYPRVIDKTPIVDEPEPSGLTLSATPSGLFLNQWLNVRASLSMSDHGSPELKFFKLPDENMDKKVIWSAP